MSRGWALPYNLFLITSQHISDMETNQINNENELWPEDQNLFDRMNNRYTSVAEQSFFEQIHRKMLSEYAPCGELLISPRDNADGIGLHRDEYDEFIIGHIQADGAYAEHHVMKLSDALGTDLCQIGFMDRSITLLQWLRENDYANVMFYHNNAYM